MPLRPNVHKIVPSSLKVSEEFSENLCSYQKNLIYTCGQIVKIVNVLSLRNYDIVRGVSSRHNIKTMGTGGGTGAGRGRKLYGKTRAGR